MEYDVIIAAEVSAEKATTKLTERVSSKIKQGWMPLGGVTITVEDTWYSAAQAVTRS